MYNRPLDKRPQRFAMPLGPQRASKRQGTGNAGHSRHSKIIITICF